MVTRPGRSREAGDGTGGSAAACYGHGDHAGDTTREDVQAHAAGLDGQHYDVRLSAPDGYQAQRSYSVASPPERVGTIDLTVERLDDGEVSGYLHDVLVVGDQLEVRGPIGGYFVWEARHGGPLLLVAGGSGVVPLAAMVRHRAATGSRVPVRLLYSVRTPADIIYAAEWAQRAARGDGLAILYAFTRSAPPGWAGYTRRIDVAMLRDVATGLGGTVQAYICGPTAFVEVAANGLVEVGVPAALIRTERFGPTGGLL